MRSNRYYYQGVYKLESTWSKARVLFSKRFEQHPKYIQFRSLCFEVDSVDSKKTYENKDII